MVLSNRNKQKLTFRPFVYFGRTFTGRILWAHMTARRLESKMREFTITKSSQNLGDRRKRGLVQ